MRLYAHPFSSYCQKVLIALYENEIAFDYRSLDDEAANAELAALWPLKRFPVLVDGDRTLVEATVILEYLDIAYLGPTRLIPTDPQAALDVRMMDRIFDNYIMTPMQQIVFDARRDPAERDAKSVADAKLMLDAAYAWLNGELDGREWAAGDDFGLADCAAAPSLFYADWVHPIAAEHANLRGYRQRLLDRPSFARAVDEARPYQRYFPPGAPDRD
jgi:glutathione S-transferase